MTKFKVGDRVSFKSDPEHLHYRDKYECPHEFVIVRIESNKVLHWEKRVSCGAYDYRVELVEGPW